MKARKVVDDIFWVGAVDWDRRMFDSLVPIPEGTSYNAYVVRGKDKVALIDTVEPAFGEVLLSRLADLGIDRLDYVVANHAEQDHSGMLPKILERYPEARVLCTAKCKSMLLDHLAVAGERLDEVKDGESIDLGGKSLRFIHFPWVHWPETMLTYVAEAKALFPCDLFGAHLATNEVVAADAAKVLPRAELYYAEIMMPFRDKIAKGLAKVDELALEIIAPSHGPVLTEPQLIIEAYRAWTGPAVANKVVIPYISMHGSTRLMVDALIEELTTHGILVERIDLEVIDLGKLALALVDAATVIFGTPTVLMSAHPNVLYAALAANLLKPKVRHVGVIGSFGWGGKSVDQITTAVSALKAEVLPPVLARGTPDERALTELAALAAAIAAKHAVLGD
ncbi:MAG: MBL fold hydrolase [Deltaproteobacteria bacterium RIFOXYB12_FULL_58_9]|nr:MAG: MBL fold hydrolase [Deltaproteobacteria bacterium RIFOXYB12_FULL_58_9]